jgi:muramidase (phage lysozyme)
VETMSGGEGGDAITGSRRSSSASVPRSERQWDVEAAEASGSQLRDAGAATARGIGRLFGAQPKRPAPPPSPPTAAQPVRVYTKRDAARDLGAGAVLDRIAMGEGPDRPLSYDTTYGYGAFVPPGSKPLTEMTLEEVADLQAKMLERERGQTRIASSAVGAYQFLDDELIRLSDKLDLPRSTLLTPGVQDMLAREILLEQGYGDFLAGKIDADTFQARLANKWASVAQPQTGRSVHNQRVGTSTDQMRSALDEARAQAQHLITDFNVDPYERRWR